MSGFTEKGEIPLIVESEDAIDSLKMGALAYLRRKKALDLVEPLGLSEE